MTRIVRLNDNEMLELYWMIYIALYDLAEAMHKSKKIQLNRAMVFSELTGILGLQEGTLKKHMHRMEKMGIITDEFGRIGMNDALFRENRLRTIIAKVEDLGESPPSDFWDRVRDFRERMEIEEP